VVAPPRSFPHPYYLDVYRIAAPSIDFYSPDIYWPDFVYGVQRYRIPANPIFVPEARLEPAPYNALYAYGEGRGSAFAHLESTVCGRQRRRMIRSPQFSRFTDCWTAFTISCPRPRLAV
jgi:hypothetical protein